MRKIFLALFIGSLWVVRSNLMAEEIAQAANVNFEPARPATVGTNAPAPAQRPASAKAPTSPATPRTPAASPAKQSDSAKTPTPATPAPPTSEIQKVSREELTRRHEAQLMAQPLIEEGLKLYYNGNYEAAVTQLEQALKILPRAKATEVDYDRAAHGLTESYTRLAEVAFKAHDNATAKKLAQKALEYDARNRPAESLIVKIKRAEEEAARPSPVASKGEEQPALDQTPEFLARRDEIKKLFRQSRILFSSGQYDAAEERVRQILVIDHDNADAYTLLQQINDARLDLAVDAEEKTRSLRLWQVADAWLPKVSSEVKRPSLGPSGGIISSGTKEIAIRKKLNEIIFPEISLRQAAISDVLNFLAEESRRLDPEKVGVNIVGGGGLETAPVPTTVPPGPTPVETPTPVTPTPPTPGPGPAVPSGTPITLNLRNVPMMDALNYVTEFANLKLRIEPYAVLVLPHDAPEAGMVLAPYQVTPGVFGTHAVPVSAVATGGLSGATFGGGNLAQQQQRQGGTGGGFVGLSTTAIGILTTPSSDDIKQFFINAGVQFPTNSTLVYNERTSTILVYNTPEQQERIQNVLAVVNAIPPQVEIEAKFVEISQNDLDELGFQWNVAGKQLGSFAVAGGPPTTPFGVENFAPSLANSVTSGNRDSSSLQGNAIDSLLASQGFGSTASAQDQVANIAGILTNPQFQLIIKALSQKTSADLLSAPKITTISGHQAQVRIAQEFIYPTSYTVPTAQAAAGSVGNAGVGVTPSVPSSFNTREVGVLLNVIPTVGADGYTINLSLIPEVSQFLGFINYGSPIGLAAGNNVVTIMNDIKQPLFSTRSLATSIVIWDGQTVVLGGLINETVQKVDDKVPFLGDIPMLGRLFRSKVTSRQKRNLLMFVTVRLIDPAGNPVHRQETAGLRQDTGSLQ